MFEKSEEETRKFISDVALAMNLPGNQQTALRVITSVFHVVRDIVTVEESLHLISQLPLHLKGIYVTDWHLASRKGIRNLDDFISRLQSENERTGIHDFPSGEETMLRVRAVFRVLKLKISPGMIENLAAQFPMELKDLLYETVA